MHEDDDLAGGVIGAAVLAIWLVAVAAVGLAILLF